MSDDLISRSAFLRRMIRTDRYFDIKFDIMEEPAVDAVIPVRCKDCKHGRKSDHAYAVDTAKPLCECNFMYGPHQWHEYCSWGERRTDHDA